MPQQALTTYTDMMRLLSMKDIKGQMLHFMNLFEILNLRPTIRF
jgi:hypothetical protein